MKKKIFQIIARTDNKAGRIFDVLIITLILFNVFFAIIETVESIHSTAPDFFKSFEIFSVLIFSVEYVLRLWTCTEIPKYSHPVFGRVRFALTPLIIIDLLAIFPFYLPFLVMDLRSLRVIRLLRILRLAKLGRYSQAIQTFRTILHKRKAELASTLVLVVLLLLFSASIMYHVEKDAQPENFSSIPSTLWWAVGTLTTVGYGDIYPITPLGKIIASVVIVLGIGLFALPTGILAAGFLEEVENKRNKDRACPHCGKKLE